MPYYLLIFFWHFVYQISKVGLSTKIHAVCDALGNPVAFHLTPGMFHDLDGADALIEHIEASALLADKA